MLAERWMDKIRSEDDILPFGWYQPPPFGMSVLFGSPPDYGRLHYRSLRDPSHFPGEISCDRETIIYPYFSAIDRMTAMIGDYVATYYQGESQAIKDWMGEAYHMTKRIAASVRPGMKFSELYHVADDLIRGSGAQNNTFTSPATTGGLQSNIGHTVPYFNTQEIPSFSDQNDLAGKIAKARQFINDGNHDYIRSSCAFTIEPQLLMEGYPMVSFHMMIVVLDDTVHVVEKFFDIFEFFGMAGWLSVKRESALS